MSDRIGEPWGRRTPYGPDGQWPTRVDMFLEQGLSEADVDSWVQAASVLHSDGRAETLAVTIGVGKLELVLPTVTTAAAVVIANESPTDRAP